MAGKLSRMRYLVVAAILLAGCGKPNPPAPELLPQATPANTTLRNDDPELDAAVARARGSLDTFLQRLAHPQKGEVFSVEAAFPTPDGGHEHLWIGDVTFKRNAFTGTLTSKVAKVPSLSYGQTVTVKRDEVTDWMILRAGRSEGGFTVKVLLDREGQPR